MRRSTSGIAARPMGTLSQKIHSQAAPWAMAPPTTGPPSTAKPVMPAKSTTASPPRAAEAGEEPQRVPLWRGGVVASHQRERTRRDHRRAHALDGLRGDQPPDVR